MARVALYCARYKNTEINVAPLGIGYIAAYLMEKGIVKQDEICIVDSFEELYNFQPDIIGISSVSQVISDAIEFAKKCKKDFGCFTILGGYHITCLPTSLPKEFDIGVIGEGEQTFLQIIDKFDLGELNNRNLRKIKGICYKENGHIKITEPREFIKDLDTIPQLYRHKNYSDEIPVITSRGCPYKCTFCASHEFWKDSIRFRSAESVIDEINNLVNTYNPKVIKIVDDLWIADKKRFRKIIDGLLALKIQKKVSFTGFVRSNLVAEEDIKLLKSINYQIIRFGAETGSDNLLKKIKGHNISINDHQRLIDLCEKYELPCSASFIFGIPGETRNDFEKTIEFLQKNKGKLFISGFYFFNPIPGTSIWKFMKKNSMIQSDFDYSKMTIDLSKNNYKWDKDLYFNEANIPFEEFKKLTIKIREEFVIGKIEENDEREIKDINDFINIYKQNKLLVLFGASELGKRTYRMLVKENIKVNLFCDNDCNKWNNDLFGVKIVSPHDIPDQRDDVIILITSMYYDEIRKQLVNLGFNNIYYLSKNCFKS